MLFVCVVVIHVYLVLRLNGLVQPNLPWTLGSTLHRPEAVALVTADEAINVNANVAVQHRETDVATPSSDFLIRIRKLGSPASKATTTSKATKLCDPVKRFIYIKTHKSGSSTLTNIFHRFATKYNVSVALPKRNYFLGWPLSSRIPFSYVATVEPPQIWCSAHTRYDYELLNEAIPNATFITVLRDPVSHFISSWNYWSTADHIREIHPEHKAPTMEEFLHDPSAWWKFAKRSDFDLLQNSASFDLGLDTHYSTENEVRALIEHMDKHFGLVLITEYMDESLLLLKRMFCWEMEDILYYALKVGVPNAAGADGGVAAAGVGVNGSEKNGGGGGGGGGVGEGDGVVGVVQSLRASPIAENIKSLIRQLDFMDVMLHNHFNKTLWKRIAQEKHFFEELAQFREAKEKFRRQCLYWQDFTEDMHRKALAEKRLSAHEYQCHVAQLDSPGYVKFLKRRIGIKDPECMTQGQPRRRIIFIKTHKTGSSTITNILHRGATRYSLRIVLPKNNFHLGWPYLGELQNSYLPMSKYRSESKDFEMLCSAHARLDFDAMDKLVPDASYLTILRDPIKHFQSSWEYWHISDHIFQRTGKRLSLEDFLSDVQSNWQLLQTTDINVLHNSMVFDLGLPHSPTQTELEHLTKAMKARFSLVMIQDYMDESIVMLRRTLCWSLSDVVTIALKVSTTLSNSPRIPLSSVSAKQILSLNWADKVLYDIFNKTLWENINAQVDFDEELAAYRAEKSRIEKDCRKFMDDTDTMHRKKLWFADITNPQGEDACRLRLLDSPDFVKLLKYKAGIKEKECHTQGRKRTKVVFIKTHKTGSSTITNILHRFALNNKLRVVLPKDNMFLGWPYLDIISTVQHYGDSNTYDIFTSGHTRFHLPHLQSLIPNAQYFTIFRDPVAHFLSSWHHWHIADHITFNGFTAPTVREFVLEWGIWMNRTKWTDPMLIHNSIAFDMGLSNDPTSEQVANLIDGMEKLDFFVLITEMMDESLVLMRRLLCWDLDDIVYLSLKVTPRKERKDQPPDAQLASAIRSLNSADVTLYEHFKQRLQQRISEEVDFNAELIEFRRLKDMAFERCRAYIDEEEDRLRKVLMDPNQEQVTRECVLMALDSKGFVKHLKKLANVPFPECSSASTIPWQNTALIYFNWGTDDIFANVLLRKSLANRLSIVLPPQSVKGTLERGGDHQSQGNSTFHNMSNVMGHVIHIAASQYEVVSTNPDAHIEPNVLASAPFVDDIQELRKLIHYARIGFVMDHPINRFWYTWQYLNVSLLLRAANNGVDVSMDVFLENPTLWWPRLPAFIRQSLENPVAKRFGLREDFGLNSSIQINEIVKAEVERVGWAIYNNVDFILFAERLDDSLIALRRWLCWSTDSIAFSSAALQTLRPSVPKLSATVARAIEALNWADIPIYESYKGHFKDHVESLVDLDGEKSDLLMRRAEIDAKCAGSAQLKDAHTRITAALQKWDSDTCEIFTLSAVEFTEVYRAVHRALKSKHGAEVGIG